MQRVLLFVLLLTFCAHVGRAESEPVNLFVQWIHATNEERPEKGWVKIGPKLRNELSPVFQWKHFWQIGRSVVRVQSGEIATTRLDKTRKLEISLQEDGHLSLTMYRDGTPVRKMKNLPLSRHVIMGGDTSKGAAWFAVVRRDKPSAD